MWRLLVMMTIVNLGGSKRVRKEPLPHSVGTTCEVGESEQDPKLCTLRRRKRAMTSIDKTGGTTSTEVPRTSTTQAVKESVSNRTSTTTRLLCQTRDSLNNSSLTGRSGSTEDTQPSTSPISGEGNVPNTIDTIQSHSQRRKRGRNINKKAADVLEKITKSVPGARITLTRDIYTKKFVGVSATYFATEVGIVMRKFCPLEFHTWEKVPKEIKEELIDRLREKFELPHEDEALVQYVDYQLQRQWKRTRSDLKKYWTANGGIEDPVLAKSKIAPNCRTQEDWEHMCKYWETEKAQKYAKQMKENRKKLTIQSRGGSRSIANHKFAMTNKETQLPPYPIEVYYKLHYNKKWLNEATRIEYENIVKMNDEECAKLASAGTIITPELRYEIEQKAVTTVCSKLKTLQSGWDTTNGPVMRKKDIAFLSARKSSQSTSQDEVDWKSKYATLEEEQRITKEELRINQEKLKQSEETSEKIVQFMISKFPEARDTLFTPAHEKTNTNSHMDDISDEE